MITKSLISIIILLTIILLTTYLLTSSNNPITAVDLRSQFSFHNAYTTPCRTVSPLKVYMYDLPNRFNVAMLSSKFAKGNDDVIVTVGNVPAWPGGSGLKQQHSVEYWMMMSLLCEDCSKDGEAVRVLDPDVADVFFVPFFSSLSFNTHGRNMTDPDTEVDRQLQVDILKFLRQSTYWQRTEGRDHVIPMHHPNAFRFLREEVNASILIVADFGRYSKVMSNLRKDVVAPYMHVMESFVDDDPPDPYNSRTTLLFFRGRTVRKSEGVVRAKLEKILKGYKDVHYEASYATGDSIKASSQGMRSSKFCLNPAGDTPSSNRLFDAIVSHCVPVIVSDKIELPFEDELDYNKFSVFFSIEEALVPGYMVEHLRKIPKEKWLEMWRRLKEVAHHYEYQFPPKKDDAVNMIWKQVQHKVPAERLAVNRARRLKVPDWWR
ncbi:Exostosin-like protein [Artemisia annua]|uniref:Exostosin-like protein n=1 Tax=Artemisia annua TaxID=35608 RepID=A0A2U1PVZ1_ARTAN|nr:Exostosin-like protein [Artemisia annua]